MTSTVSDVDIANRALSKLGERRITSLAQGGNAADTMNDMYSIVRDAEIEAHPWNFTKTRVQLTADPTAPTFGFTYRYKLPADYIRLLQVGDLSVLWAAVGLQYAAFPIWGNSAPAYDIEGDYLLTDYAAPLDVIYGARVTDTTIYPLTFVEALACRLAYEACEKITDSGGLMDRMNEGYQAALKLARRTNAIMRPAQPTAPTSWITSRRARA